MCLYSYDNIAARAKKRIVTYKSAVEGYHDGRSGENCSFFSVYYNFIYEGGKLYHEPRFPRKADPGIINKGSRGIINEGFHSHADIAEAEYECVDSWLPATIILRCEIPRGAYYYKGKSRMGEDLCSDFLIVTGWKKSGEDKWHNIPREKSRLAVRLFILKVRLRNWWYSR